MSYLIADMDTGQVLAAKNPHAWLLPASTLKTLTSLVVMPARAGDAPSSSPPTTRSTPTAPAWAWSPGATYTVDDLFHGLVLMSGNDTAYALADAYGGRDKTIAAMNAKAAQLGAWDTVAVDPSGLDAPGQHSSAYDLALLGRAVMQLPAYRQVAATKTYTFPGGTDRRGKVSPAFEIQNHNQLLENYPGTIGIKNGYTTGARNTFIGAVTRGGRTLLITQMGSHRDAELAASGGPARLGVRQRRAAAAGRAPSSLPGAAQPPELGGTPAPTTAGTPVPVGDDQGADPRRDDLVAARGGRRAGRAGRQPGSVAARVGRRPPPGTRSCGWPSSSWRCWSCSALRRWVRRAGPGLTGP